MKPLGGFFELEIAREGQDYHPNALAFTTGRSCLNYILRQIKPSKLYLPYYCCDALIEPIILNHIKYEFYSIDKNLDPCGDLRLKGEEYLIYINYFGLKENVIQALIGRYKGRVIIDNSQAFFERGYKKLWSFNSARKFFGVPDGAYLYAPVPIKKIKLPAAKVECNYLINRLLGYQDKAFRQFRKNEEMLTADICGISEISKRLLANINYNSVIAKRRRNFAFLAKKIDKFNLLKLHCLKQPAAVPMFYPYLPGSEINRKIFYKNMIYMPIFWKEVLSRRVSGFDWEKELSRKLIILPIDHRIALEDLERIAKIILRDL
ncbi:MAG: hypothetical protein PHT53_04930 [Candidatus Omnitrophica bacterium]|nr:hypothetical protein [Candidatus Omnitrophota bacterium]